MKVNNILRVKRSDWNETAKRLECAGWYYIGTPTATGKTIYRRDSSELEIIIEEEPNNTPTTMNANGTTENKTMYTDYYTAVNWCHNHRVMCNNIAKIDPSVYDNARFAWYDEETEADTEIFQWFITDCSEDDVDFLESRFPGLLFTYSDLLDCFVLCVDHFGTMWKGVAIETTLEYAAEKSNLNR